MVTPITTNLSTIISKVRNITARPSTTQITDDQIAFYINTFYLNDFPEHLRLESLRVNYQFTTNANIPVYDFPTGMYLTNMPPVFIAGYQSFMTQSRQNFFRINPQLNFLQQIYTGNGTAGPYTGQFCINTPITPGFKPNPPGAYSTWTSDNDIPASQINYNILVSALASPNATSGIALSMNLVDDGQGNLFDINATTIDPSTAVGSINYITGALDITTFPEDVPSGNQINVQYIPYVPSRPQSCVFYQDQFYLYPIPDQAYTVSFEAYQYPTQLLQYDQSPQLYEWWQLLAYGAADKIFADNGDFENLQKYRPLLEEQMNLAQRRTIVQQTSERVASIYTEQTQFPQYPFGNLFSGF